MKNRKCTVVVKPKRFFEMSNEEQLESIDKLVALIVEIGPLEGKVRYSKPDFMIDFTKYKNHGKRIDEEGSIISQILMANFFQSEERTEKNGLYNFRLSLNTDGHLFDATFTPALVVSNG